MLSGALYHYNDVIMSAMASHITSLTIVYSTVYPRHRSKKHQSSASLAFAKWIHRWPVNFPHKGPVTRKNVSVWWRYRIAHIYGVLNTISEDKFRGNSKTTLNDVNYGRLKMNMWTIRTKWWTFCKRHLHFISSEYIYTNIIAHCSLQSS